MHKNIQFSNICTKFIWVDKHLSYKIEVTLQDPQVKMEKVFREKTQYEKVNKDLIQCIVNQNAFNFEGFHTIS